MTKSTVHSFAKISSKVLALAALAKNPFARDSSKMLNYFFELEGQIPETYHWKFTPTAALIDRLTAIEDHAIWNDIYWRDIAENIQAFSILSYKRTAAILKPAIRALNTDEFLATAILARSALELAAWSLYHTTSFRGTIAAIPTHLSPDSTRFTANGLQTQLVKV